MTFTFSFLCFYHQFLDACDKFGLRQTGESNKYWRGDLILKKSLDFEERFSYAVLLTAFVSKVSNLVSGQAFRTKECGN